MKIKLSHSPALLRTHVRKYTTNIQSQAGKDKWAFLGLIGVLYAQILLTLVFYVGIRVVQITAHKLEFDTFNIVMMNLTITSAYVFFGVLGYLQFRNRYKTTKKHFIAMKRLRRIKKNPYLGFDNVPIGEGKKK